MSKTAYEIESELMGSAVTRTGFGGRPEMINFYIDNSGGSMDISMLPTFRKLDLCFIRCGKVIPVLTVLGANGASTVYVCGVDVAMADGEVSTVTFTAGELSLVFTVATGTWAVGE